MTNQKRQELENKIITNKKVLYYINVILNLSFTAFKYTFHHGIRRHQESLFLINTLTQLI